MHFLMSMNSILHSINSACEKYTIMLEYKNFQLQAIVTKHEKFAEEFDLHGIIEDEVTY